MAADGQPLNCCVGKNGGLRLSQVWQPLDCVCLEHARLLSVWVVCAGANSTVALKITNLLILMMVLGVLLPRITWSCSDQNSSVAPTLGQLGQASCWISLSQYSC